MKYKLVDRFWIYPEFQELSKDERKMIGHLQGHTFTDPNCVIPDALVEPIYDFEVGMAVEVVDASGTSIYHKGDICEIADMGEPFIRVKRKSDGKYQYMLPCQIKPVSDHKIEARRLAESMLLSFYRKNLSPVFYIRKTQIICRLNYGVPSEEKQARAVCSPDDEFDIDIGKMICLCKLSDNPLPGWVLKK